jgi:hypothetical protein
MPAILLLATLLAVTLLPGSASADSADYAGLQVQGRGEARYLGMIKVYDAALYSPPGTPAERMLDPDISRCLDLKYAVSLKVDDFIRGADTVLARQYDEAELVPVRAEIDALHRSYRGVAKGDRYALCYDATTRETTLALNREELVRITSADFARVYFGIWLGPEAPLDEKLRDRLLATQGR